MMRFSKGFTLIELLVVLSVVGILMAIAIPSYSAHVQKTRRANVKATMMEISQALERRRTNVGTYSGFTPTTRAHPTSGTAYYTITIDDLGDMTYTISAEPQNAQEDDSCGVLTLDHAQRRGDDGTDSDRCWN